MIYDKLENSDTYIGISEKLKIAFDWLKQTDLKNIDDGKYTILNNEIYANVQCYTTKDNALFEAHRTYTDIQYIVEGEEKIGTCDLNKCTIVNEYNPIKDIEFVDYKENHSYNILSNGKFCILFPGEAHKPSIKIKDKLNVKKVVIKVKL